MSDASDRAKPISGGIASIAMAQAGVWGILRGLEVNVYGALLSHSDAFTGEARVSVPTIAREVSAGERQVQKALASLADKCAIRLTPGGGRHKPNFVTVETDPASIADAVRSARVSFAARSNAMRAVSKRRRNPVEAIDALSVSETPSSGNGNPVGCVRETPSAAHRNPVEAIDARTLRTRMNTPPNPPRASEPDRQTDEGEGEARGSDARRNGNNGDGQAELLATLRRHEFEGGARLGPAKARRIVETHSPELVRHVLEIAQRSKWVAGTFAQTFDDAHALAGYVSELERAEHTRRTAKQQATTRRLETEHRRRVDEWDARRVVWHKARIAELGEPDQAAILADARLALGSLAHFLADGATWGGLTRGPLIAAMEARGHRFPEPEPAAPELPAKPVRVGVA